VIVARPTIIITVNTQDELIRGSDVTPATWYSLDTKPLG
jgi:hypothetical protein